jgi:hypothetical protein
MLLSSVSHSQAAEVEHRKVFWSARDRIAARVEDAFDTLEESSRAVLVKHI